MWSRRTPSSPAPAAALCQSVESALHTIHAMRVAASDASSASSTITYSDAIKSVLHLIERSIVFSLTGIILAYSPVASCQSPLALNDAFPVRQVRGPGRPGLQDKTGVCRTADSSDNCVWPLLSFDEDFGYMFKPALCRKSRHPSIQMDTITDAHPCRARKKIRSMNR